MFRHVVVERNNGKLERQGSGNIARYSGAIIVYWKSGGHTTYPENLYRAHSRRSHAAYMDKKRFDKAAASAGN